MKKIWKCPHCPQLCTRRENLKRHLKRKHDSIGEPILEFISGNLIFNPYTTQSYQDFQASYSHNNFRKPLKNNEDNFNRTIENFCEMLKLQMNMNSLNQSSNMFPEKNFPQIVPQWYGGFIHYPAYQTYNQFSGYPNQVTTNYDGVIGFKTAFCPNCFTTITMQIGRDSKNFNIQDIHKCDPNIVNSVENLDITQRATLFLQKINSLPEHLLQECRNWANGTTGMLYLIAKKYEEVDGYEKVEIPKNYQEIHWIHKVLAESQIMPNDSELNEFLKLAKNQTANLFSIKDNGGKNNLYLIGLSNIPLNEPNHH